MKKSSLTMFDLLVAVRDGKPLPQKVSSLERMAEALEQGLVTVERTANGSALVRHLLTAKGVEELARAGAAASLRKLEELKAKRATGGGALYINGKRVEPYDGATAIDVPALAAALATLQRHEKLLIAATSHVTPIHAGITAHDFGPGAEGEAMLKEVVGEVAADAFAEVCQALASGSRESTQATPAGRRQPKSTPRGSS